MGRTVGLYKEEVCMLVEVAPCYAICWRWRSSTRTAGNICETFCKFSLKVITKASESDSELKTKHLREILKLTTKFISEVKHTEEVGLSSFFLKKKKKRKEMI